MICNEDLPLFNNKDHGVFEKVFNQYYEPLELYACYLLRNQTDAEDIVMGVFSGLYKSEKLTFKKVEKLHAYLFWITKKRCLDLLEAQQKQRAITSKLMDQQDDNDNNNNDSHLQHDKVPIETLLAIVNQLPKRYGEVARMILCERLSYSEIAARLNIKENDVSKLWCYAIKVITNRLYFI